VKLKKRAILVILILITASLFPAWPSTGLSETMSARLPKPDARPPAPDFALPDLDGNTIRLSDHHGSAVLMGFWTTW
jgi:hypothetical protein